MSKTHGNSHDNDKEHHIYAINDALEDDIFKYGISSDPIGEDGLSKRVRNQLTLYNTVVGWARFWAEILLRGIKNRKQAEDIENEYIDDYKKKHGRKPRGNLKDRKQDRE